MGTCISSERSASSLPEEEYIGYNPKTQAGKWELTSSKFPFHEFDSPTFHHDCSGTVATSRLLVSCRENFPNKQSVIFTDLDRVKMLEVVQVQWSMCPARTMLCSQPLPNRQAKGVRHVIPEASALGMARVTAMRCLRGLAWPLLFPFLNPAVMTFSIFLRTPRASPRPSNPRRCTPGVTEQKPSPSANGG